MKARTIEKYLEKLKSPDATVRHEAAEALAEADDRAIYPLINALRDENAGVQDAAMRSLINIGGEVTAYMLLPLLREEAYLRNTAIIILQQLKEATVKVLKPLLMDRDDDIRKFALDIISNIGHCDYEDEVIQLLRKDPNPNVRGAAAKTIKSLELVRAEDELISALDDEEWVVFSALEALSSFKSIKSVPKIAKLVESPLISIRVAAIESLSNMGSKAGFELLTDSFCKVGKIEKAEIVKGVIKNEFYDIAKKINGIEDILLEIVTESSWEEKILAIKGLISLGYIHNLPKIIDIAGSLDPTEPYDEDYLFAVKDILRHSGCNDFFIEVINSDKYKFRAKVLAIEMVGELQCEKSVPHLINILQKDLRDIRRASINALSNVAYIEEVQKVLLERVSDPDSHVRKVAITSLGKIGKKEAFNSIWYVLIHEKYADIISECFLALENIDRELLLKFLKDAPLYIREFAKRLGFLMV